MEKILIYDIKYLYTNNNTAPVKGNIMRSVSCLEDAYIYIEDGIIKDIGTKNWDKHKCHELSLYNAEGTIAIPGLIDSHTHLVFGGSREHEFSRKIGGEDYLEILKSGGGILSTVRETKIASFEELYSQAKKSLDEMLLFGVTTIEAKSGYGLDLETEVKSLEVLKKLNMNHPIDIHITYLGAHALPKE
jgi:imidazolonepropionase